jgi:hypothetical protein
LKLKPQIVEAAPDVPDGVWFSKQELNTMTDCWQKASGKLVYDPKRHDFRKSHKAHTLILEVDLGDADLYYQHFLEKKFGGWYKTQRPMFGLHVTVVRGDEFRKVQSNLWNILRAGHKIEIEYNPTQLRKKWQFWSIPVRSEELQKLRRDLGLKDWADLHITVAREYKWQMGVL